MPMMTVKHRMYLQAKKGLSKLKASAAAKWKHRFGTNEDEDIDDLPEFAQMAQQEARLGVLYIFGNGTSINSSFGSVMLEGIGGVVGGSLGTAGGFGDDTGLKFASSGVKMGMLAPVEIAKMAEDKGSEIGKGDSLWVVIRNKLEELAKKVWDKIKEKLHYKKEGWGMYVKILKTICASFASRIWSEAAPLSGALDIAKGITTGGYALIQRIDNAIVMNNTSWISGGHTEVILQALQRAMAQSMGEGFWKALKGGLGIGLEAVTAGAGKLASMLAGFVEVIYKVCWRLWENSIIKDFLEDAKYYWERKDTDGLHTDGDAFTAWFNNYALSAPVIAATALNSGFCGSAWEWLNLYTGDGLHNQQGQFAKGTAYLNRLRPYAAWYQKQTGVYFHSSNGHVDKVLKAAKDRTIKYTGMMAQSNQEKKDKKPKRYKPWSARDAAWDLMTS